MPKTNKERLQDNNIELQNIKTGIDNLPEYQDIKNIYHTSGFSQKNYFGISSYSGNAITFYKDYTFICYGFSGGLSQGTFRVYKNNILECTGSYRSFVSTTNVDNCKMVILGENTDTGKIYMGMPYNTTSYDNKFSIGYYDTSNKTVNFLKTITLPFTVYYNSQDITTSNDYFSQLYYDETLIMSSGSSGLYMAEFNFDTETIISKTSYFFNSCRYVAPNYFLPLNSKTLYKVTIYDPLTVQSVTSTNYIDGVSYDGTKIFINGSMYELTNVGTVGNLIASNVYTRQSGYIMKALNDTYYLYNHGLYKIVDNKFELQIDNMSFYGNTLYNGSNRSYVNTYNFETTMEQIGIIYNEHTYLFPSTFALNNDKILVGNIAYTLDGVQVLGTMPDNGALNYTPTTSQQTIPAGYTSGGTIEAIDYDEQGALSPADTEEAEEQINDLFGEGE